MISRAGYGRIHKLPPVLVNQIAAGEVIERPASVVKELIENSIDAGAVHIRVELEEGGKRLIRVTDDGVGIVGADLPLAVASHATSKLTREEPLHSIRTLGFRGEALASIASIADLEILSRPSGDEMTRGIIATAQETREARPEAIPCGTRVTVRNLFASVPARRRFLKSTRAEAGRVTTLVQHIALAIPTLALDLVHGGRTVLGYPKGQSHEERIREVLGEKTAARLLPLPQHPRLRGWVGRPDLSRRTTEFIYVFLNGRFVRDRVVMHAVKESYRGFQIPGHNPVAVLFLNVEPDEVDVNVHPAKLEVRFRDSGAIHSLVRGAVRATLEGTGSVPRLLSGQQGHPPGSYGGLTRGADVPAATIHEGHEASRPPRPGAGVDAPDPRSGSTAGELVDGRELRVFQVRNAYLVVEEEDGLTIIDQHALHEKILYEEILASRERGQLRQALLIPETVDLAPEEWEHLEGVRESLAEVGFELEEFGDRTVLVRAVPAGYERFEVGPFLRDVLGRLAEVAGGGDARRVDLREHLLATLACKRAVKAGERLPASAQLDLVRGRARAFHPQNCPHGRPAELFISWQELDRRFDRK